MRKIAANLIYPVNEPPISQAYLVIDAHGTIVDLVKYNQREKELAGVEYYSGVLIPGFVNAHCHLELSHLKGKIAPHEGLGNFVSQVQNLRVTDVSEIEKRMAIMLRYMWSRGINGLGDVVNQALGLTVKMESPMSIHNFVELFNQHTKTDAEVLASGLQIQEQLHQSQMSASLSPHSYYGTQQPLFHRIAEKLQPDLSTTLHFLESHQEAHLPIDTILSLVKTLQLANQTLLVHNVFTNEKIIDTLIADKSMHEKLSWVLCPNSNLYIHNKLPDVALLAIKNINLCLGTDSLASNQTLSILDEMKTLTHHFPELLFDKLLQWATLNGAKALKMQHLGSFTRGKTPGVLLLTGFDFKNRKLTPQSEIMRLV